MVLDKIVVVVYARMYVTMAVAQHVAAIAVVSERDVVHPDLELIHIVPKLDVVTVPVQIVVMVLVVQMVKCAVVV